VGMYIHQHWAYKHPYAAPNFQVFEPLDFIAEVTQHVPNAGQHLIHYYGWYSNKSRGVRRRATADPSTLNPQPSTGRASPAAMEEELSRAAARRRWAALIKRVYEVDPLVCPQCGGQMRVIAFVERRQRDVIGRFSNTVAYGKNRARRLAPRRRRFRPRWNCATQPTPTASPRRKNHSQWPSTLGPRHFAERIEREDFVLAPAGRGECQR